MMLHDTATQAVNISCKIASRAGREGHGRRNENKKRQVFSFYERYSISGFAWCVAVRTLCTDVLQDGTGGPDGGSKVGCCISHLLFNLGGQLDAYNFLSA